MKENIRDELLIPEVPKVLPNEQLFVYVPIASYTAKGIVAFDDTNFDIIDGKVFLKSVPVNLLSGIISEAHLPFTYHIDDTLTEPGAAAEASKVGREFETLLTAISELVEDVDAKEDRGDADNKYNVLIGYIETLRDEKLSKVGGTILSDLTVLGDFTVKGKVTSVDVQTVKVEDNVFLINANALDLDLLSGLAINTGSGSAHVYGIMYDPVSDGVKIGDGRVDENGDFYYYYGEDQYLATVDWTIPDGNLAKFNQVRKTFEDSGISAENVATKSEIPKIWRY